MAARGPGARAADASVARRSAEPQAARRAGEERAESGPEPPSLPVTGHAHVRGHNVGSSERGYSGGENGKGNEGGGSPIICYLCRDYKLEQCTLYKTTNLSNALRALAGLAANHLLCFK